MDKAAPGPWDKTLTAVAEVLIKMGTEGVMTYLSVQFPFLNAPVLKQIVRYFVNKIIDVAITRTEMGAYFGVVDLKTGHEGKEFDHAGLALQQAQEKGDPNEIARLEQEKMDAFRKLVRIRSY